MQSQKESIPTIKGKWATREVWMKGKLLSPAHSQGLRNHSPDGFNWGYGGSGPAQLALAILAELIPDKEALEIYQDFKWEVIAKLPQGDFELSLDEVWKWIDENRPEPEFYNGEYEGICARCGEKTIIGPDLMCRGCSEEDRKNGEEDEYLKRLKKLADTPN